MLIINLIDKERLLSGGSFGGEPNIIWRARLFLFIGFALMAGGLAGSVVSSIYAPFLTFEFWANEIYVVTPHSQIHRPRIGTQIPILWIRKRVPKRVSHASGCGPLARGTRFLRIRVQSSTLRPSTLASLPDPFLID